jgi:hypothetical protein
MQFKKAVEDRREDHLALFLQRRFSNDYMRSWDGGLTRLEALADEQLQIKQAAANF